MFKSSSKSVWPILCALHQDGQIVIFPIALTYGSGKPKDLEFLEDTVTDLEDLLQNGFVYEGRDFAVILRSIVCDAPAKAMVKATKLYSGYHGCDKCAQEGEWFGRMTYQEIEDLELRTDESFRRQEDREHHNGVSVFCNATVDMVLTFSVDYMHQVCLGVMRRLLLLWLRGKKEVKMSATQASEISQRLERLKTSIPSLFARKPRGLQDIDRWKATEYRQFLLYTGKIVLRGVLRQDLYDHFLGLSVAMSILVRGQFHKYTPDQAEYADQLLKYFVSRGRELYGPEFLVYNVHSLLHICNEAEWHDGLDNISAFPFENYLQQLKKLVRSGKNPLAQIVKRLSEIDAGSLCDRTTNLKISSKRPNNAFVLDDDSCCEVISINGDQEEGADYMCRVYGGGTPLFNDPCDSRLLGIFSVNLRDSHIKILPKDHLKRRAIMAHRGHQKAIFMAILHL